MVMVFKNIHGTKTASRVAFLPWSKDAGFSSARDVFMNTKSHQSLVAF